MAHLWRVSSDSGEWESLALDGDAFIVGVDGPSQVPNLLSPRFASLGLRRVDNAAAHLTASTWTLLVARDARVRVNGYPVPLGVVALADRDEIRLGANHPLFFSTETLAEVAPFPHAGPSGFCPRCKQHVEPGTPAVRCPSCGLWHHQSNDLPCWTYGEHCSACPQETALDAGFRWTPGDL